jgi:RNA-binding protein YlmH
MILSEKNGEFMKQEEGLKKRFIELANKSYNQGIYTFTEFLGLNEQSIFSEIEKEISHVGVSKYGGTLDAERIMIRFGNEEEFGYTVDFPVVCLSIKPLMQKFADELNHRDFLGALMNLGIAREKLGDIIIHENEGYIFCEEKVASYIIENLTEVKHTSVSVKEEIHIDKIKNLYNEDFKSHIIIVDSKRIDAIIAKAYKISRSTSVNFVKAGKVFINGKQCLSNSQLIKTGDIVSVRGKGRIKFNGNESESKKGRLRLEIWK